MTIDPPLYDFGLFSVLNFLTFLLAVIFSGILLIRKHKGEILYLSLLFLSIAVWAGANTFETAALTPGLKEFWSAVSYLGTCMAPFLFFLFSLDFSKKLNRRNVRFFHLLGLIPVAFIVIAATNRLHNQLWPRITIDPVTNLGIYEHGMLFWGFVFYQYLILSVAIINLVAFTIVDNRLVNRQLWILILGAVFPIIGNILYVFKLIPPYGFDWTPITFWISSFLLFIGIRKYRLFDIIPTARGQLIEEMSIGYMVTDSSYKILDCNYATLQLLGIPHESAVKGVSVGEFLPQLVSKSASTENSLGSTLEKHFEVPLKGKYINILCKPILNSYGRPDGQLVTLQDITERKEAELSLDAYAHTVAHDLKNPLGSIKGFLYLMEDEIAPVENPVLKEYLGLALRTTSDMQHIIDEFLILATIRTESIEKTEIDMNAVVNRVMVRLDHLVRQYSAVIEFPQSWPRSVGYRFWIEEVWANYISNAIKYGGKPPVIRLGWDTSPSGRIRFWVEDNGPGISPDTAHRLFKSSPERSVEDKEVHGLGLSIVKRIMDRLGGEAAFENLPGKGTRFFFTLEEI